MAVDSITTGGTAENALAADATRRALCVQNLSDEGMWVNLNGTAAPGSEWYLAPGQSRTMYAEHWPEIRNAVSIYAATTGKEFAASAAQQI